LKRQIGMLKLSEVGSELGIGKINRTWNWVKLYFNFLEPFVSKTSRRWRGPSATPLRGYIKVVGQEYPRVKKSDDLVPINVTVTKSG